MGRYLHLALVTCALACAPVETGSPRAPSSDRSPSEATPEQPQPDATPAGRTFTDEEFAALFLTKEDANKFGSDRWQDGPGHGNHFYALHNGVRAGMHIWEGGSRYAVTALEDGRMVFPGDADARAYLEAIRAAPEKGAKLVPDAKSFGDEGFATSTTFAIAGGAPATMFRFYFRRGNVVADVGVIQLPFGETPKKLTAEMAATLAAVADARVAGAQPPAIPWAKLQQPGVKPVDRSQPVAADEIRCTTCGEAQKRHLKFCLKCGALLPHRQHGGAPPKGK